MQYFEHYVEDLIFELHEDLATLCYQHGPYQHFHVFDPPKRYIGRACVRNWLVHQMLYATLTEVLDTTFIFYSFSCRVDKGTHAVAHQLQKILSKVSHNGKQACFALKIDVQCFLTLSTMTS